MDLRPARLAAQLLTGPPAATVEAVVERVLAVQAQDGRGFRLAVRARSAGLTAADVDRALTEARSLVVSWLNRGTLHLVPAADWWWLHPLTAPQQVTTVERSLRQLGVTPAQADRGVDVVRQAVRDHPRTRRELRDLLDDAGVPTEGQAIVYLLYAATVRHDIVRGPVVGAEQAFVGARDWLGPPPPPLGREEVLGRLARRYLAGHGPASPRDLAAWAGITLGDARTGFEAVADEVVPQGDGVRLATSPDGGPLPPPRLLGAFDPVLHGWSSREPFVGPHGSVVTVNGLFRPFALVGGRAVATWRIERGAVVLDPLEAIPQRALAALERDAADVLRYLGLPPRPLQTTR